MPRKFNRENGAISPNVPISTYTEYIIILSGVGVIGSPDNEITLLSI
ncbi:MAG: hypothetical protein Q8910_00860 [Bacteroidota bacterium]|nr:hypothetical protein [Bacteroidota bacterium]